MIGQYSLFAFEWREEFVALENSSEPLYVAVISAVLDDQALIVVGKRASFYLAVVEDQHHVVRGLQNSLKFSYGFIAPEPVCCLGGSNQVDAVIRQGGRFGGTGNAGEVRECSEIFLSGAAHVRVRLDAENWIAIFEKQPRKKPGAGGNIRDYGFGAQPTFVSQDVNHAFGIRRPKAHIGLHPRRKSFCGRNLQHSSITSLREQTVHPVA